MKITAILKILFSEYQSIDYGNSSKGSQYRSYSEVDDVNDKKPGVTIFCFGH